MRHAWLLACSLFVGTVAREGTLFANGRFPRAERLLEDNGDPQKLVLAATYGLLVTEDRGAEWRHICELGYAFSIDDIDPLIELPPDGALLVTAAHSLNRSARPFCSFEPVLGSPAVGTETVVDYSLDHADRNRVLALFMSSGDGGLTNELYESLDAGKTFSPLGVPLPRDETAFSLTLDVAPSDANRIYVSATGRNTPGLFARSDDRGASWTTTTLPVEAEEYPYIAAVHPTDPSVVYVRTDYWPLDADGVAMANDGLLHSTDGGQSFRELHRATGKLFGFALSPDASEVIIGYGDPVDSTRLVDETALGIYRASTSDHVFTKIFEGSVTCLTWTETGVYVCTSQEQQGFALGFAENADFELGVTEPLLPLLELADVKGPLDCPACSSGTVCRGRWPESCAVFGNCDAGAAAAGGGGGGGGTDCPAAGMTGGGSGPGGSGALGGAGAGMAGSPGTSPTKKDDSSCGCRAAGARAGAGALAGLVLLAMGVARRRIRRGRGGGGTVRGARDPRRS